jgi:hypothetical protein
MSPATVSGSQRGGWRACSRNKRAYAEMARRDLMAIKRVANANTELRPFEHAARPARVPPLVVSILGPPEHVEVHSVKLPRPGDLVRHCVITRADLWSQAPNARPCGQFGAFA